MGALLHKQRAQGSHAARQRAAGAAAAHAAAKAADQLDILGRQAQLILRVGGQQNGLGAVEVAFQVKGLNAVSQHNSFRLSHASI